MGEIHEICYYTSWKPVSLGEISHYLDPNIIPLDVEVPSNVLPFSISKNIDRKDMVDHFGSVLLLIRVGNRQCPMTFSLYHWTVGCKHSDNLSRRFTKCLQC